VAPPCLNPRVGQATKSGWEYLEFTSGHDAMVISPDALSDLLVRCASDKSRS
jgi:hypothetical protein